MLSSELHGLGAGGALNRSICGPVGTLTFPSLGLVPRAFLPQEVGLFEGPPWSARAIVNEFNFRLQLQGGRKSNPISLCSVNLGRAITCVTYTRWRGGGGAATTAAKCKRGEGAAGEYSSPGPSLSLSLSRGWILADKKPWLCYRVQICFLRIDSI